MLARVIGVCFSFCQMASLAVERVEHASQHQSHRYFLVELDVVISQDADVLLLECSPGVMSFLIADEMPNLFDR